MHGGWPSLVHSGRVERKSLTTKAPSRSEAGFFFLFNFVLAFFNFYQIVVDKDD
jgi:hypothetical protein